MLVIGAEGFGPAARLGDEAREKSNKLKRAEELNAQQTSGPTIQILTEVAFCGWRASPTPDHAETPVSRPTRDLLVRYRALREDHVRYLVKCGILRPVLRTNADTYFSFPDLAILKQANDGFESGRVVPQHHAGADRGASGPAGIGFPPRCGAGQDHHVAAGPRRTGRRRRRRWTHRSPRATRRLAEEYFRAASLLDEGDDSTQEEAAVAYRKALELDPYLVAALINLANIHYSRDELAESQALYERAIGLESDFFEAHFNLGNIYHDLARFPEAQACYREALRLNPFYADAATSISRSRSRRWGCRTKRARTGARISSSRRRASGWSWRRSSRRVMANG